MGSSVIQRDQNRGSGVVVDENDGARRHLQRPLHHFARIDRGMVHRAALLHLVENELVALVEEQDAELWQAPEIKRLQP